MLRAVLEELVIELAEALLEAAKVQHEFAEIIHDGEPSRYCVLFGEPGAEQFVVGQLVMPGDRLLIFRGFRLIVEPLTRTTLRPLNVVAQRWSTM